MEMDSQEMWVSLRQQLSAPVGRTQFGRIFGLLQRWEATDDSFDAHEFALMLEYAEAHLRHWEPRKREVHFQRLWPTWPLDAPHAAASLARSLVCHRLVLADDMWVADLQQRLPEICSLSLHVGQELDLWSACASLPQIQHLQIERARFGQELLPFVMERAIFPSLRTLQLSSGYITDRFLRELAQIPGVQQLEEFDLSYNQISSQGIVPLLASFPEGQLKALHLSFNRLGGGGSPSSSASLGRRRCGPSR